MHVYVDKAMAVALHQSNEYSWAIHPLGPEVNMLKHSS